MDPWGNPVLASNNEHDWTPVKYLNILQHNKSTMGTNVWPLQSKMIMATCRNFDVYLHSKNELQVFFCTFCTIFQKKSYIIIPKISI